MSVREWIDTWKRSGNMSREELPVPVSSPLGDVKTRDPELARQIAALKPRVVCLCGSTRFWRAYQEANRDETRAGRIVLTVGFFVHGPVDEPLMGTHCEILTAEEKARLDVLHLRKIDLADEVLVLNVGGYIGASTAAEITYAECLGKPVRYLEPL